MTKRMIFAAGGVLAVAAACYAVPVGTAARPAAEPTEVRLVVGQGTDRTEMTVRLFRDEHATKCEAEWKRNGKKLVSPIVYTLSGTTGQCQVVIDGTTYEVQFRDGQPRAGR
jgi:hypothetical protein